MGPRQNIQSVSSKYLVGAKAAVAYTRRVLDIGAANKKAPWDYYGKVTKALCAGTAFSKGAVQEATEKELARIPSFGYGDYVNILAANARHLGCGNCGPHSAVAFVYLRDNLKITPLDWMMYNDFEHAFVIVGRSADTEVDDRTTWNRDAAICDPYRGPGEAELVFPYANIRFNGRRLKVLHRAE